jgi:hypothetical protein
VNEQLLQNLQVQLLIHSQSEGIPDKEEQVLPERMLEQYALQDEADVLTSNDINNDRDLSFIDEDVRKTKLMKVVKALGAPAPGQVSQFSCCPKTQAVGTGY